MGCAGSRNKSALSRLNQYQLASIEDCKNLKQIPNQLEDDEGSDGVLSLRNFHNMFYDGFYAPYIRNPDYLLLVDVRDEERFVRRHVVTAKWHGRTALEDNTVDLTRYCHIVFYDTDGSEVSRPDSKIRKICRNLREKKLEPLCLAGGFRAIELSCPYMVTSDDISLQQRALSLIWFPSVVLDQQLYLGRADQAAHAAVLSSLHLTHIVSVTDVGPGVGGSLNYLNLPINENKDVDILSHAKKLSEFIHEAFANGGRVLIYGDQGVNRSAILAIAFIMQEKMCTLEDAYYYVKRSRPAIQPTEKLLNSLAKVEEELFGKKLTSSEDLCY